MLAAVIPCHGLIGTTPRARAVRMLEGADSTLKARLYGELGITLTYQPERAS